ncbi:MAG TPA: hypothetical protein VNI01_07255 [Elusimicrobiota bacterium]|jgi:hypothetical protein|nr:hypothetical protein [Elusimicrobiota bacterium]
MGREIYILFVRLDDCQRFWFGGNLALLNERIGAQWQAGWGGRPVEAGRFEFGGPGLGPADVTLSPRAAPAFAAAKSPAGATTLRLRSAEKLAVCDDCEEIVVAPVCPVCDGGCRPMAPEL